MILQTIVFWRLKETQSKMANTDKIIIWMWTLSKIKLIMNIKIYHWKILFWFFYNTKKITFNVVDQGGQVEEAKFVTWKTTKVCQVSSFLALTFECAPPPYFICENNRKSNKIMHCVDYFFWLIVSKVWAIFAIST